MFVVSAACAADTPVFLYSRWLNAQGESRYLPDGNYKQLLDQLGKEFKVEAHGRPLTRSTLANVGVVLIANPSEAAVGTNPPPHHLTSGDVRTLKTYIENGGGIIIMGNQENHNLEVTAINTLLQEFGMQWTNLYTDAKLLPLPRSTPIIGGLRWAYYTGNLILLKEGHAARPRALVTNDLAIKPPKGTRDQPGVLMATAEPGRGRVVVVTDAGWLADWAFDERGVGGVSLKGQDNYEIFRRLALWAAKRDAGTDELKK